MPLPQFFPPAAVRDLVDELPGAWKAARDELRDFGRAVFRRSGSRGAPAIGPTDRLADRGDLAAIPWPGPRRAPHVASARCLLEGC